MRKYSTSLKKWHDRHCRLYQKKKRIKINRYLIHQKYKPQKYKFTAPMIFSLINNREETEIFFNSILDIYAKKNSTKSKSFNTMYFDLSQVEKISPDAIMYLIALVNNIKYKISKKFFVQGSFPKNEDAKKILIDFGFLNYVNSQSITGIKPKNELIQIISGCKVDPDRAAEIIDFIKAHSECNSLQLKKIYTLIIEIMANTVQHAYNDNEVLFPNWYICVNTGNNIEMTILDTGSGIPSTVSGRFKDILYYALPDRESRIISSALDGDFRTETKQKYRGKGLPCVVECYNNNYINEMLIISGKGSTILRSNSNDRVLKDSKESFLGTIFLFSI